MPLRPPSLRSLRPAPIPPQRCGAGSAWSLLRCRSGAVLVQAQQRRGQHDEVARKNHYERLNLRHDATPAEIKKSFYSLSKTHHPDANPTDPNASNTFSLLSESYTVLSDKARRTAYDRDVLRVHHAHHNPHASYHSTSPAGGRSPSGLSRRRGTFRGPPPSFYRSGGWGNQGEKRRQAHEESTGFAGASHGQGASSSTQSHQHSSPWGNPFGGHQTSHGGMGPGDDPYGHQDEVPHFNKAGHTRTHRREDQRRKDRYQRRAVGDDDIEFEPQTSIMGHFFIISGILVATILAPLVYIQFMRLGRQRKEIR
ncbi:hypothetical protein FZEAL_5701 [Fusarium zealandicum]|uniref:J domain-containing protein n=1 Tax=Fusarium zealandicum TaxID=1053134 RepID=A0A8H4UJ78_9HYPO|nr:hypothetical protein FZEAL_5701 [Fusarium zealandicum]